MGSTAVSAYTAVAYAPAVARLNKWVTGINFTATDIGAMLQLCAYEVPRFSFPVAVTERWR